MCAVERPTTAVAHQERNKRTRSILMGAEAHDCLYHEKQDLALCGVHALNNLMQGPAFGAGDLAAIALKLDEAEQALLDDAAAAVFAADLADGRSHRLDQRSGDFSFEVLAAALETHGCQLINCDHASVAEAVGSAPEAEEGFLVHRSSHWFALRRVASLWWNVDSKLPRPVLIVSEDLATFIGQLRAAGHTLHVARSATPLPLPERVSAEGHEAVFHPLDYLLQYPPLDPYAPVTYLPDASEADDAAAAAAVAEAQIMDESEAAAQRLQAQEWGGIAAGGGGGGPAPSIIPGMLGGAGGAAGAAGAGGQVDADAALAAALMAADMEELERQRARTPGQPPGQGNPAGFGLAGIGNAVGSWFRAKTTPRGEGGMGGGGGGGMGGGGGELVSSAAGAGPAAATSAAATGGDVASQQPLLVGAAPGPGTTAPLLGAPLVASPLIEDAMRGAGQRDVWGRPAGAPGAPGGGGHAAMADGGALVPLSSAQMAPSLLIDQSRAPPQPAPGPMVQPPHINEYASAGLVAAPPPLLASSSLPTAAAAAAAAPLVDLTEGGHSGGNHGGGGGSKASKAALFAQAGGSGGGGGGGYGGAQVAEFDPFPSTAPQPPLASPAASAVSAASSAAAAAAPPPPPAAAPRPAATSATATATAAPSAEVRVPDLLAMGFAWDDIHTAIEKAGGDLTLAQEFLLEGTLHSAPTPAGGRVLRDDAPATAQQAQRALASTAQGELSRLRDKPAGVAVRQATPPPQPPPQAPSRPLAAAQPQMPMLPLVPTQPLQPLPPGPAQRAAVPQPNAAHPSGTTSVSAGAARPSVTAPSQVQQPATRSPAGLLILDPD